MKEWLTLIIVLLIIIIVFDGWRRMRNARYGNIRMSSSMRKRQKQDSYEQPAPAETPSYTSELPNGGARVIGRRDPELIPQPERKVVTKPTRPIREPEQAKLNLGESVPLLMEEIQEPVASRREPVQDRIEPTISGGSDNNGSSDRYADDEYEQDNYEDDDYSDDREDYDEDEAYDRELDGDDDYDRDVEDYDREYDEDNDDDYNEDEDDTDAQQPAAGSQVQANPEEVLIINVMAHKGEMFNGSQLLDTLLQCGMRYGDMDIFHRYSDAKGEGALLFSMANMVKPGTFDLDAMDEFQTPGISLFMTLPLKADSMQSFELMLDTAKILAEVLKGELKDEQRSVMTRQTIEHCRQRILDFERRRLFQRPR